MTSMIKTLKVFRTETVLVERERAQELYTVASFYSAKVLAELPLAVGLTGLMGVTTYFLSHPEPLAECLLHPRYLVFTSLLGLQWQVGSTMGVALGVMLPSVDMALEIGKMLTMVMIIFGGLYFDVETLPSALRWLPAASPVKRA
eukprot:CAMPEP_0119525604 /NCGR_PEP_ID=MMETSP1344-20130328/40364_1 /TAXON_ID=236787 /ORGANISM="Florenciella parvula, Strain CCMP2471" /LENGTH=144 /DNA_ID=CAMNT_0007564413 /DNA_START=103 /DNA_END=533 /DNA_ORIENTATION=+